MFADLFFFAFLIVRVNDTILFCAGYCTSNSIVFATTLLLLLLLLLPFFVVLLYEFCCSLDEEAREVKSDR